ncbi:MAG: type II toxin-antitoxin system PemK/MazF family toxin [Terracidiphilus sp.]|nr:type II toxin-antitoxin system PemK/MazF family toxin [Terracidiphilus sp.]
MNRGELYRVSKPPGDPKRQRVYVIVSRQMLIDSRYSSVICAPIYTEGLGLATQVAVGPQDGLKHESWIHCDNLVSFDKSVLTDFVGTLSATKIMHLNRSLAFALDLPSAIQ